MPAFATIGPVSRTPGRPYDAPMTQGRRAKSLAAPEPFRWEQDLDGVRLLFSTVPKGHGMTFVSTSESYSVDMGFVDYEDYHLRREGGPAERHPLRAGDGVIHGGERVDYIGTGRAMEFVEITPSRFYLDALATELGKADAAQLGELRAGRDAVIFASCVCIRHYALSPEHGSALEMEATALRLFTYVMHRYFGASLPRGGALRLDTGRMNRVAEFIESRIVSAEAPSLNELADVAALSRFHFLRAWKATTGLTPHAYVSARRLVRGQVLLRATDMTVAEIAAEMGYANPSHFRRRFKTAVGVTPSRYKSCFT